MKTFSDYYNHQLTIEEGFKEWLSTGALAASLAASTANAKTLKPHKIQTPSDKARIAQVSTNAYQSLDYANDAAKYIAKHEGFEESVYKCQGELHIGIGHKLVDTDKELFNSLFRGTIDYKKICNGTQRLNKSQVYALFSYDLNNGVRIAMRKYPNFLNFPKMAKIALIDSIFRGEVHHRTDKLINAGEWQEAAKAYLNDEEYRKAKKEKSGIAARMEQNAALIKSAQQQLGQFASIVP